MSISQADIDEECLVFPAITKNYSEVKSTDGLSAELNNIPSHNPNSVSRPLRSTLKTRSKFEPDKIRHTDKHNSERNNTFFTVNTREPIIPETVHKIHKFGNMEKNSTTKGQLSTLRNDMEICDSDQSTSCGSKEHLKRPSIQQLRKYSVVDPNTLKFIEDPSRKSGDYGICSAILITISYLFIIITFPFSLFLCIKVVAEYERAVIFRLGRILPKGARGPGLFFIAPCIDSIRKVDLRTVTFDVPPQEVLTKDSVTVAVDAVVYYRIYNPVVAITNVEDADRSTRLLAATTLRNVLGTKNLAEILSERESISTSMQTMLDDATDPWGVKVERVEVKDVRLPVQLQRAMAAEAEATREARAKVIAAEGEEKSSFALKQAADVIKTSPFALQLRYLQTLSAISAEKNSTIIFPLPIDLLVNLFHR
ncbi:Mechanosensory protein [Schistosoma japonicum]|uniref:Mechanosensory protein n=1 Tax=Schistosoma japonicum TaxID=6182 RepID=A0A4Z2DBR3_SCHJA|nr:Mechanosensory protein 2 [Schistosoma japonicum]TNN13905.1 Mechanosensory protein [Schistosoma japonicum]